MKKNLIIVAIGLAIVTNLLAGNPDRRGESGAAELNMNPYARSAGFWAMNVASVKGVEAERLNPAGLGYTRKIEAAVAYSSWMTGSGVSIIQGAYAHRIKNHSLALSINNLAFKPIPVTTTDIPETTGELFKPNFLNIGLSYAHNFNLGTTDKLGSNIITGGITMRLVNESAQTVSATGFCVDLGVMYTTGKKENVHFGVSLRNLGTPMTFKGDALGVSTNGLTNNSNYSLSFNRQVQKFEMPIQLNIGFSYDAYIGDKITIDGDNSYYYNYRITPMVQMESNAYGNDNYGVGLEFAYKELFMVRAGYRFQNGIFKEATRLTAHNGFAAGASAEIPFRKDRKGMSMGIDYAYRMNAIGTSFKGTHTVGIRFNFAGPEMPKFIPNEFSKKDDEGNMDKSTESKTTTTKKSGKKTKITQEEFDATQQKLADLEKANQELKIKAETPIVKIDTVVKVEEKVVVKVDTLVINNSALVKTEVVKQGDKTIVKFTDTRPIMFKPGSAEIQASSYKYLDEVAKMMNTDFPNALLSLSGHTDNTGDAAKNKTLSQERVNNVKAYLVKKGVATYRIPSPMGYGSERPIATNDTEAGRAANRRVELILED